MALNQTERRALQYIVNTSGQASKENFFDDHAPIGERLWNHLEMFGYAFEDFRNKRIYLTDHGLAMLQRVE